MGTTDVVGGVVEMNEAFSLCDSLSDCGRRMEQGLYSSDCSVRVPHRLTQRFVYDLRGLLPSWARRKPL